MAKANGATKVKIEKGIPLPYGNSRSCSSKYPFLNMKVGDSLLFPEGYVVSYYYKLAYEFTFRCRAMGQMWSFKTKKTPDGYRCWRVE